MMEARQWGTPERVNGTSDGKGSSATRDPSSGRRALARVRGRFVIMRRNAFFRPE